MTGEGIDTLRKEIQLVINFIKIIRCPLLNYSLQAAFKLKSMGKSIPTTWFLLEKSLLRERTKRMPPLMNADELQILGQVHLDVIIGTPLISF